MTINKRMYRLPFWIAAYFLFLLSALPTAAQQLKKLAILELVNLDKNANVEYLVSSITEAMDAKLSSKFEFQKADKRFLRRVAEENFFYKDDFATRSVALNLGLLSKQDVVISGGFTVQKSERGEILSTTVRIFDMSNKKIVAEIQEKSPLDSTIFESVDKITDRIVDAAKVVLPTKEDWQRSGGKSASTPWFNNWSLQAQAGGALYAFDYADRIRADLPALRFSLGANFPLLSSRATIHIAMIYLTDKPIAGKNPAIEGLNVATTTLMPGFWLGYQWERAAWSIAPRVGAGYAAQTIRVTGVRNESLTNGIPFVGLGADLARSFTQTVGMILSLESALQIENQKLTTVNTAFLGVSLYF